MPSLDTSNFLPSIRRAIDAAATEAKAKPNDAAANGRLGMVLQAHDQLAAAEACYYRASILDDKSFEWLYYRAVVQQAQGRNPDAVWTFRQSLKLRDYLPAKLRLGEALLTAGASNEAANIFQPLTTNPAGAFGYGKAAAKPEYFEKALQTFPQYGAAMFALAQHYQRIGRNDDAARLMRDYPKFKTTSPPADDPAMDAIYALNAGPSNLLRQAMSLEAQGELAAAAELNERVLHLDPKLVQAHVNLISAYGRLGDAAKAEQHYRKAIALNPNASEAHYNFGVLCYAARRRSEAQAAFEKTIQINPGNAEAHGNLGSLLQEEGKLEPARKEFEKAVELQPDFRAARFHLGRIYANQGRWDAAIAQFREITRTDDESTPTYLYALGATLARSGNREAKDVLQSARSKAADRGQTALVASIDRDLTRLKQ